MNRLVLAVLAAAAAGAVLAPGAGAATHECQGLMVCVPVAGPWVIVPVGRNVPRPRVEFQLTCPRGHVVGGLDAELTDRAIDVTFSGTLGSPVNPGITTARSVVVSGVYVGASARTPSFRPHIGCVPGSGGGRRIPTAVRVVPPGHPAVRHVRTVRVRASGPHRVVQACAGGERLIAAGHAVGFFSAKPPSALLAATVSATRALDVGRVSVSVRTTRALGRVRAVVQVWALCAGGT